MSFRLTAVLFGAVLAVGLVLLGLALWEDDSASSGALMPDLAGAKPEEIKSVALERADGSKLVLERAGKDRWRLTEPVAAPAEPFAVANAVSALLGAKPTAYGELSSNPAVHGLDKPGLRVTLTADDGKTGTLNVGNLAPGGTKAVAFVTTPTRTRPMAVPRSAVDPLLKEGTAGSAGELARWANDYRAKDVFGPDARGADDVTAVKLALPNKKQEVALARSGGGWTFAAPAGWGDASAAGDTSAPGATGITGVRPLLAALTGLRAAGTDDFLPDTPDLKPYGLNPDNPDLLRVELTPKDGPPQVAYVGKKADPGPPPPGGFPPPGGKVYVRVEGVPGVVRATPGPNFDGLAAVAADPSPLRDRDLLKDAAARTDAIDITVGKDAVKLRKVGGEWRLYGGPNDPQPANQKAVADLLALLGRPRLVKDFPAANDARFAPNEVKAEVKLWADAVEANTDPKADPKAEPKLRATVNPTVLQFGARDPNGVSVRRALPGGAKADFLLPDKVKVGAADADLVAAAGLRRLDLLDPKLPGFSQFQANRLTLSQGPAVTREVVKEKAGPTAGSPDGGWVFAQPDAQKGRPADGAAVANLLTLLATEQVGKFVAEQPTKDDLARFGLTPENPRQKAAVGLDPGPALPGSPPPADADKERVYFFGSDTDDKGSVYARVGGKEAVFTVPRLVVDRLTGADLRDKTVVRFDPAKVDKVRVEGWYEANRVKTTLVFTRAGGTWTAEGGFPVDPAKVDEFLKALEGLRAKAFVPGPPQPGQRFPVAPEPGQPAQPPDQYQGLQVNVELEGGKRVDLNVGAATDGGASYFVWCGTLPANEQVVTVDAGPLKPFKEKPAAFAK
ncbi:MAG: DUF4340 domain-containing protein [Gemmataceae bacterium]|nr:DUF4340 domain-containing protein [Gemmataceae bacterium]